MAWADLVTQIESLLEGLGLAPAPELFNIQLVPATLGDKNYCILADGLGPNIRFNTDDRFYPFELLRVSVIFELGNNTSAGREAAQGSIEDIVRTVVNPAKRSTKTHKVNFTGARSRLINPSGFWIIYDLTFSVESELMYL